MLLIFGFAGFNAASQLTISHPGDGFVVAQATFNSFLACSSGGITSVLLSRFLPWFGHRSWNYGNLVNGALAGMVIHFIRKNGADDYTNGSILFFFKRWPFALDADLWLLGRRS